MKVIDLIVRILATTFTVRYGALTRAKTIAPRFSLPLRTPALLKHSICNLFVRSDPLCEGFLWNVRAFTQLPTPLSYQ
jgi:hypothetical protein